MAFVDHFSENMPVSLRLSFSYEFTLPVGSSPVVIECPTVPIKRINYGPHRPYSGDFPGPGTSGSPVTLNQLFPYIRSVAYAKQLKTKHLLGLGWMLMEGILTESSGYRTKA